MAVLIKKHEIKKEDEFNAMFTYTGALSDKIDSMTNYIFDMLCTEKINIKNCTMYSLSNGSYFKKPNLTKDKVSVCNENNFYDGIMTPEALGITATLYAINLTIYEVYNQTEERLLSMGMVKSQEIKRLNGLYYKLRDYALTHNEESEIMRAVD